MKDILDLIIAAISSVGSFGTFIVAIVQISRAPSSREAAAGSAPSGSAPRGWLWIAIAGLLLFVVSIVSLFVLLTDRSVDGSNPSQPSSSGLNTSANATPPPVPHRPIRISDPSQEDPPRKEPRIFPACGTGDIQDGQHLWLFVLANDGRHYPQGKVDAQHTGSWFVVNVNLGTSGSADDGGSFNLLTIVADDSTSAKLDEELARKTEIGYNEKEWSDSFQQFVVGNNVAVERDDDLPSREGELCR